MKLIILSILTYGVCLAGCKKIDEKTRNGNFKLEATVVGKGLDCGEVFIISLKSIETNSEIEDSLYYADNLASEYKKPGLKLYLNCREPVDNEIYPCTTRGPGYPHVIVINSANAEQ